MTRQTEAHMARHGVLPRQMLREMMELGDIDGIPPSYLNPASIDLPLADEAFCLHRGFLTPPGTTVREFLKKVGSDPHDLRHRLEVGVPYLIRVDGAWKSLAGTHGRANPKSSTGRIFVSARVLADGVGAYDTLPLSWSGELWVLVRPEYFPIRLSPGVALAQVRLFEGERQTLGRLELDFATRQSGLLFDETGARMRNPASDGDAFLLSVEVDCGTNWVCRGSGRPLDLRSTEQDAEDFFEPVAARGGMLSLRKGDAYILATHERVMVPPWFSAELRAVDPRFGEFRVHSAGYVDPGFGWGKGGEARGCQLALELTAHEDLLLLPGQHVASIEYERMLAEPDKHYEGVASNYVGQQGRQFLAKFLKR